MSTIFIVFGVVSLVILLVLIFTTKSNKTDIQNDCCFYPSLESYQEVLRKRFEEERRIRKLEEEIKNQIIETEKERMKHLTDRQVLEEIKIDSVLRKEAYTNDR